MQQQEEQKRKKTTKRYDEVCKRIRKLLDATAQTFIPELCEALAQDWYPDLSKDEIKNNSEARDKIRDKVFSEWSNERGNDTPWGERAIRLWLADFVKNPDKQTDEWHNKLIDAAAESRIARKSAIDEREKQKLDKIADSLPNSVILPPEREQESESGLTPEVAQELGVSKYGDTGKSRNQLMGAISESGYKLIAALSNNSSPPISEEDDMMVDYIRPSKEFRKGLFLEADKRKRVEMHNLLHNVILIAENTIEIINEIDGE
ncbi:MAG TPA: hypothetical protein VF220_01510 [Nitrososphaeraceae archaeon]